ncbi:MAG: ATP-binding protein [Oscillospiraceae bacterium]|jgi:hypothetical protein|nr:ATP-binding protein [Oscillospiraceae bacterium]
MKELSLHILDIAQNSLTAGASLVELSLTRRGGLLTAVIKDNGRGMTPDMAARVTDPFTTTRTTRRVGLGLPLWKLAAEQTGGSFALESAPGVGTTVTAAFVHGHIDTPPLGDIVGTVVTLIQGAPSVDFVYRQETEDGAFALDTRDLRRALEDVPLDSPDVLAWVGEYLQEQTALHPV